MLSKVEVITGQGETLLLTLDDSTEGVFIESIEGLDPVNATIVSSSSANADGEAFQSSRRGARNIKFKLSLDPDPMEESVEELRARIYAFLMPKTDVKLRFHISPFSYVEIMGHVESCEAPLFVQEPVADVSIMCLQSDFVDPNFKLFSGDTTSGLTETELTYEGTVNTSILFTLYPGRTVSSFTVYHRLPDGALRTMDFAYPLIEDDVLKINSQRGSKGAILTRAGVDTSVLYSLTTQSDWLELRKGVNKFRVHATGAPIPYAITYYKKLGGL